MSAGAVPVLGYAPDMDQATPGVLTSCLNLVPNEFGMTTSAIPYDYYSTSVIATIVSGASIRNLSGTSRIFVGTANQIYESTGSGPYAWTSVGSGYSLASTDKWVFAGFGNSVLAATPTVAIQRSTGGAFSTISGAPSARIVVNASGFAVAFNTSTASDEWYCSAYLDETNWTLDVTTQCVKGRLTSTPGEITAALPFGDDIIVYKDRAVYRGVYVGAPAVWQWTRVSTSAGCSGVHAVTETPLGHVFASNTDVFLYDGTAPFSIAQGQIRARYATQVTLGTERYINCVYDKTKNLVYVGYNSNGTPSTINNNFYAYHLVRKLWGRGSYGNISAMFYLDDSRTGPAISPGGTTAIASYDTVLDTAITTANAVYGLDRQGLRVSSWATHDFQDPSGGYSYCDRFTVLYDYFPKTNSTTEATTSVQGYVFVDNLSAAGPSVTSNRDDPTKYDMRQTGLRHNFVFTCNSGYYTIRGYNARLRLVGGR